MEFLFNVLEEVRISSSMSFLPLKLLRDALSTGSSLMAYANNFLRSRYLKCVQDWALYVLGRVLAGPISSTCF
jgi:hypothetical protein